MKSGDDSLPQVLLAVLGPTDRLEHVVELVHAAGNHAERIASTAHDAYKVVVVGWRDVMQASLSTHAEPADHQSSSRVTAQQNSSIKLTGKAFCLATTNNVNTLTAEKVSCDESLHLEAFLK